MFGRPSYEVIGNFVDQLFPPSFYGGFLALDEIDDGSKVTMEATLVGHAATTDGKSFHFSPPADLPTRLVPH